MLSLSLQRQLHYLTSIRNYPPRIKSTPTHHTKTLTASLGFLCSVPSLLPCAMRAFYAGLFAYLLHFGTVFSGKPQSVTCAIVFLSHPPPCALVAAKQKRFAMTKKRGAALSAVLYFT